MNIIVICLLFLPCFVIVENSVLDQRREKKNESEKRGKGRVGGTYSE